MANIVPEIWRDRPFRSGEQGAPGQSIAYVLPAHDVETISASKAQHRLGKLVNQARYERYVSSLDQLLETRPQQDTSELKARRRHKTWPGPGNGVNRDQGLPPSYGRDL